jgi:hypothetical protein
MSCRHRPGCYTSQRERRAPRRRQEAAKNTKWKRLMLLPLSDVPRWYAQRKPQGTLLRDERAAWMKEGRAFRIMPARARAHAE